MLEPLNLEHLPTPCLVLDETRMYCQLVERVKHTLARHRVALRPHLKTSKSIDVAKRVVDASTGAATVSALAEAEYLAERGVRDLLYAVSVDVRKLDRIMVLRDRNVDISVTVDSVEAAGAVAAHFPASPGTNSDSHRSRLRRTSERRPADGRPVANRDRHYPDKAAPS